MVEAYGGHRRVAGLAGQRHRLVRRLAPEADRGCAGARLAGEGDRDCLGRFVFQISEALQLLELELLDDLRELGFDLFGLDLLGLDLVGLLDDVVEALGVGLGLHQRCEVVALQGVDVGHAIEGVGEHLDGLGGLEVVGLVGVGLLGVGTLAEGAGLGEVFRGQGRHVFGEHGVLAGVGPRQVAQHRPRHLLGDVVGVGDHGGALQVAQLVGDEGLDVAGRALLGRGRPVDALAQGPVDALGHLGEARTAVSGHPPAAGVGLGRRVVLGAAADALAEGVSARLALGQTPLAVSGGDAVCQRSAPDAILAARGGRRGAGAARGLAGRGGLGFSCGPGRWVAVEQEGLALGGRKGGRVGHLAWGAVAQHGGPLGWLVSQLGLALLGGCGGESLCGAAPGGGTVAEDSAGASVYGLAVVDLVARLAVRRACSAPSPTQEAVHVVEVVLVFVCCLAPVEDDCLLLGRSEQSLALGGVADAEGGGALAARRVLPPADELVGAGVPGRGVDAGLTGYRRELLPHLGREHG